MKKCSKCQIEKPVLAFCVDKSRPDGRSYVCRECRNVRTAPGPAIPERRFMAGFGMAWCRECSDWKLAAEVRRGMCQAHINARDRGRYATDPDYRHRRRQHVHSRKRGVAQVPAGAAELLLETFGGECAYCDRSAETWDHIEPVARGGQTIPANIVPACASCNSSKKTQDVWEWLDRTGRSPGSSKIEAILFRQHCMLA